MYSSDIAEHIDIHKTNLDPLEIEKVKNRYLQAIHFIDSLVGKILNKTKVK